MRTTQRSAWVRYGVAFGSVVVGWLAREALTPAIGRAALPFIFFFPAVAMAAWFGGLGPGLFAVILSASAANWFFFDSRHVFEFRSAYDVAALAAFTVSGAFIVGAMEAMHRAKTGASVAVSETERQRELLATTLASIGDAVIVTDTQGRVTSLNREAERLTKWTHAEAAGQPLTTVFRIVNERTRKPVEDPVEKVLRFGKVVGMANHTIIIAKDGTELPIDDSAAPIRQPNGPLFGVVLVFRDVTVQRKAQQASERLAAIIEHSGDVILTKNLDSVIQTWNPSAQRLFGYRAEEIVGRPITVLFPPERLGEEDHILGRLREGKPVQRLETIRVAKDGRRIPVSVSISPLKNDEGEVIGASKIIHDISDLVAARDALVREKELLSTTLASIGDGVIVTDAAGRVTFLNIEAEKLTGWKNSKAAGRPLTEIFHIVNEKTRATVENPVEKVLRLGAVVGLTNHTLLIAKDGREIPIDDSAAPIRQPDGPLFGVVLVFRDFTERKRAEEALRLAKENAETANHVKDRFLATLSHELRTPLTPVLMLAAEHAGSPELPDQVRRDFDTIRANVNLEVQLIDDLLDLTRIEQGKFRLAFSDCDMHALVRKVAELLRAEIELKQLALRLELDALNSHVEGDAVRLHQVIWNVMKNAIKFTPRGGNISVRSRNEAGDLCLVISDTGFGIKAENLKRIFDAFEQVEHTETASYGGLGLGLAISAGIATAHHGRIWAESPGLGQGASFHISIPAATTKPVSLADASDATTVTSKPLRILLVEDHNDSRRSLARMLAQRGHEVAQAETCACARKLAASKAFDLAISDLGLPDGDGHALMRDLRDRFHLRGIALSGYGMPDDIERSRDAGFAAHLVKPVEVEALEKAIAKLQRSAVSAI